MKNPISVRCVALAFALFSMGSFAFSQIPENELPFLSITPDARGTSMGEAGIATAHGSNAMHYNASRLAFLNEKWGVSANYLHDWRKNETLNFLAFASGFVRLAERHRLGFSVRHFYGGEIPIYDQFGDFLAFGKPRGWEVSAAYILKFGENLSVSAAPTFIFSDHGLAGERVEGAEIISTKAFATSLGFSWQKPLGKSVFDLGASVKNLGGKYSNIKDGYKNIYLPANLGIGLAWSFDFDEENRLTLTTDFNKLLVPTPCTGSAVECDEDNDQIADYRQRTVFSAALRSFGDAPGGFSEEMKEITVGIGAEYAFDKSLFLRAGFFHESKEKGDRRFLTLGTGYRLRPVQFDFSYSHWVGRDEQFFRYFEKGMLRASLSVEIGKKPGVAAE